ncbi:type II secretion system minor pseudopilin GspH [Dongshaea marina]|uniref:type II secretion system minor pseudopilin GspH n=1 Tax=Dongshaea marina TaxID=2047966 RepID=UPI000D3E7ED4|nr:type II secretion system minor pseudopilin GspH [Dongshaea marina]
MRQRGFTLLEVLLIALLIGMAATVVLMNIGPGEQHKQLELQARRFAGVLRLCEQQAVLGDQQLGVRLDSDQYQIMKYHPRDQYWGYWKKQRFTTQQKMPDGMVLDWKLQDQPWSKLKEQKDDELFSDDSLFSDEPLFGENKKPKLPPPQIVIDSSGDVSPFTLTFSLEREPDSAWQVRVDDFGDVTVQREAQDDAS